jgi:hypothetical protein
MRVNRSLFAAAALLGVCTAATASIAYNNFGPGSGGFEYGGGGYIIGKYSSNSVTLQQGFQFTSGASGSISKVYVAVDFANPPENGAFAVPTYDLYADDGSNQLGALLSTWTGTTPVGSEVQLLTGGSASLAAGSKYWLVAREPDPTRMYGWVMNNQGITGKKTISLDDGANFFYDSDPQTQGAFRIDVEPTDVPEPFTMALMGGAAMAGYRRMRRRKA